MNPFRHFTTTPFNIGKNNDQDNRAGRVPRGRIRHPDDGKLAVPQRLEILLRLLQALQRLWLRHEKGEGGLLRLRLLRLRVLHQALSR